MPGARTVGQCEHENESLHTGLGAIGGTWGGGLMEG